MLSKSFKQGYARSLDISGNSRKRIDIGSPITDREAIRGDWVNVGGDIKRGIQRYRKQLAGR